MRGVFRPRRIAQTYGNLVPAVVGTTLGGCWSVQVTKAEIIAETLRAAKLDDEPDYQPIVIAELQRKLPEGVEIKTCEDFKHLNVECCDTCHNFYPHYEMRLIELPDGSPAWVCDTVRWAIYPEEYRKLQERSRNTPEGKLLSKIFGVDADDDPKE
jgi:hypothetical protein